jgi:hypothetical protein
MGGTLDLRAACLLALVCAASALGAEPEENALDGRPWAIGVGFQADDESNDSTLASFNWGLSEATWASFAAGRNRSPERGADIVADNLHAGLEHRFGLFGVAFDVEQWGDADALESADFGASVFVQNERLRVALRLERRAIDVHFTLTGPLGGTFERTAGVDADGTELDLRVQVAERWQLHANAIAYDYSRNLAVLPRIEQLNVLSASALTLANSLIDEQAGFGVEWEARGGRVLTLDYARDRSAVDGSRLESFDVAFLFPVARRMDLELNLGSGRSDLLGSGLYGGFLLLIYGG